MKDNNYTKQLTDECCAKCRKYSKVSLCRGWCMLHHRTVRRKDELSCFTK